MSYHGPVLVATREEVTALRCLIAQRSETLTPAEERLKAKCERVLASDPKWREPTT